MWYVIFSVIFMALLMSSCCNRSSNIVDGNVPVKTYIDSVIISENDKTLLYMLNFPSAYEYGPYITEIWYENKISLIKKLIVRSNPDCFGGIVINNHYDKYPIDSIPSITKCIEEPTDGFIIVEGPTCYAGHVATFRIDIKTGDCFAFPSNNGFIGFSKWSDDVIVSSKYNDIDYDLVLWYEVYYIINPEGDIVNITDSKEHIIENAIPFINQEAGLQIDSVKLLRYNKLVPRFKDDSFWGNKFEYKYSKFDTSTIQTLDSLANADSKWTREQYGYKYFDVDFEYGMFVTIYIDKQTHTGVITKGAFGNHLNAPQNNNK